MRSTAALAVHGLSKRFDDRVAFQDVSFEIAYGEVFGFLGPNGAGKTTTVRTLGTLIAPTSGAATVAGIPLTPENGVEIRRRISIMPETPGLWLRLTVRENLACFADLYVVADADDAHRPERDPRHASPRDRLRGRAAGRQQARLAGRLGDVRPRAAHHRHSLTLSCNCGGGGHATAIVVVWQPQRAGNVGDLACLSLPPRPSPKRSRSGAADTRSPATWWSAAREATCTRPSGSQAAR